MKNISQILNILLASALVILAVKITLLDGKKDDDKEINADSTMENIMTRTSVRSYTDRTVEPEKVEQLLQAAMAAPTAGNKQPWAFIVVNDRAMLEKLGTALPYAKMVAKAPLAIVACGDLSKGFEGIEAEYWVQDVSAATENLLLAAHALELGAVWTGVYPVSDRIRTVKELLSLPDNIVPLNVIPIGYPASATKPKNKWKPENVHYNRW